VPGVSERVSPPLEQNLTACLKALEPLGGKTIWLPLMGLSEGRLTVETSLKASLNALQETRLVFDGSINITIAAPKNTTKSDSAKLRAMVQAFVSQHSSRTEIRDSAEMQDDRPADVDLLGRSEFASALATRISRMMGWGRPSDRTSIMLQLHAPWGAGKTSFMRLLAISLTKAQESRWTVVWFNAWENQRIDPPWWMLYKTLSAKLPADIPWLKRSYIRIKEVLWRLRVGNGANLILIGAGFVTLVVASQTNHLVKVADGLSATTRKG
jgi:hypothetical protein